jgi:hypothetical protein
MAELVDSIINLKNEGNGDKSVHLEPWGDARSIAQGRTLRITSKLPAGSMYMFVLRDEILIIHFPAGSYLGEVEFV